jgi:RNA polymerase sigma-70 factor (ECF subfamily)
MHFHAARLGSRVNDAGALLLLEEQDRSRWDRQQIARGAEWLKRSSAGDVLSRFHVEAGIAAEHCLALSFQQTRWGEIAEAYQILERLAPSPLHTLNRAIAVAEWRGPAAGLSVLDDFVPPAWLSKSYLLDAVFADLHRRAGHAEIARRHGERALRSAPSDAVRELLRRRLAGAPCRYDGRSIEKPLPMHADRLTKGQT